MKMRNAEVKVKKKGSGSLISHMPLFSPDSKRLFVLSGGDVRVYSCVGEKVLQTLIGSGSELVGLQIDPTNVAALYTCDRMGLISHWNHQQATLINSFTLDGLEGESVERFIMTRKKGIMMVAIKDQQGKYSLYGIQDGSIDRCILHGIRSGPNTIDVAANEDYVVGAAKGLVVQHLERPTKKLHMTGTRKIMCVKCHSTEDCVVTGDSSGRVVIWWDFLYSSHPKKAVYHWHTLPTEDIAFSSEGSCVYSGGGECVLVKWDTASNHKDFFPRMGSPIKLLAVSPDSAFIAVCHFDNCINIVKSTLCVANVIQGLTWNESTDIEPFAAGMRYDPRTCCIVLNGKVGHIQFLSPHTDTQLYNLDITNQNLITKLRNRKLVNTQVEQFSLSDCGGWMATVERRADCLTSEEIRLKMWKFKEETQWWSLISLIEYPHIQKVTCCKFGPVSLVEGNTPSAPMLVTTGEDKKFRIWTHSKDLTTQDVGEGWLCSVSGSYQDCTPYDAAFSSDCSILAVGFDSFITIWDPDDIQLKALLSRSSLTLPVKNVSFGREHACHLLVASTDEYLMVWDVLTLCILWKAELQVQVLVSDPKSEYMAVFDADSSVYVFHPKNATPVFSLEKTCDSGVLSAAFIPRVRNRPEFYSVWMQASQLWFITKTQELMTLCTEEDDSQDPSSNISHDTLTTPFGSLMAASRLSHVEPSKKTSFEHLGVAGRAEIAKLLQAPPHAMPPMSLLCSGFISSLLHSKDNTRAQEDAEDEPDEEEEKMETDSESEVEERNKEENEEQTAISEEELVKKIDKQLFKCLHEEFGWLAL